MEVKLEQPSDMELEVEQARRVVVRRRRRRQPPAKVAAEQSSVVAAGASRSRRRKGRKTRPPKASAVMAMSLPSALPPAAAFVNSAQLQPPRPAPFVPTCYQLFQKQQQRFFNSRAVNAEPGTPPLPSAAYEEFSAFIKQHQGGGHANDISVNSKPSPPSPSQANEEFSAFVSRYQSEVEGYLRSQEEKFLKTMAEKRREQATAARRIREKEAAAEKAVKQCAELEKQLAVARGEIMAWQSKTRAAHHSAAALRANLDRLKGKGREGMGESEDAASAHVDLNPVPQGACHVCRKSKAVAAAVPCGHLCMCSKCEVAEEACAGWCPCCHEARSGTVRIHIC